MQSENKTWLKISELSTDSLFNFLKFTNNRIAHFQFMASYDEKKYSELYHKFSGYEEKIIAELDKRLKGICEQ